MFALSWMAHAHLAIDSVAVAPADSLPRNETGLDEIVGDALGGTFGDAHRLRNVAHSCVRVVLDAEQHLRVIREEVPAVRFRT